MGGPKLYSVMGGPNFIKASMDIPVARQPRDLFLGQASRVILPNSRCPWCLTALT